MPLTPKTDKSTPLLEVKNLKTTFSTPDGDVTAVNDVSFSVMQGETIGIVGESGSGKSQIFMSIMGLLAQNGQATGQVLFEGTDLLNLSRKDLNKIRGKSMTMIFQDPMTSLNPYLTIETQLTEVLLAHKGMSKKDAYDLALETLRLVKIPEPERRIGMYPHEFSGGMRQRVMIAMAILCSPKLLIADEPTTALDVTVQAQVLALIDDLKTKLNSAIVFITHDLGVIAGISDRVLVVYAGRIVEFAPVAELFANPQHPYTQGLLRATPRLDGDAGQELNTIPGQPPSLQNIPQGCSFSPRCPYVMDICRSVRPELTNVTEGHAKACHLERLPA